jgi:transglutaminase-like putative cysteine protease
MNYRVTHKTEYFYGDRVPLCYNAMHLHPRDTDRQVCRYHELSIRPAPADLRERIDFFGNYVAWACLQEPHDSLKISAISEVEIAPREAVEPSGSIRWDDLDSHLRGRKDSESMEARRYTFDSPRVPRYIELAAYASPDFAASRPLMECVLDLTLRIYREFTFQSGVTTIDTPVLDVLRSRRGVCQDFAHLEIGCLRSMGIPARYVSGYVLTAPPPGQPRLVGADASHAWVSAFIPPYGWIDFDPTNGIIPSTDHITIGWARDFDDLSPVRGVITGGRSHSLRYSVDVEPILLGATCPIDGPVAAAG